MKIDFFTPSGGRGGDLKVIFQRLLIWNSDLNFFIFVDRFMLKKYNELIGKQSNLKYEEI
jgi:hypothetical protein